MDKRELQLKQKELRAAMHEANEKNEVDNFDKLAREYREVCADLQKIGLDELASVIERNKKTTVDTNKALHDVMRQVRTNGGTATYTLQREITSGVITDGDTNNMESAGIPLSIKSLINPLELPTIYQSVGITIQTGVRGNIVWPCLNTIAEVDVAGETVELEDKSLDFSKITAVPQRLGLTITVTNEAIDDASFDLEGVITAQIQAALARVINTAVVGDSGVGQLVGPFANGDVESVTLTTDGNGVPTYQALLNMMGVIMGKGVELNGFCYVMNTVTYANLMSTPITAGDSRMICEGGKIAGFPVYVTDSAKIADNCVNAGCFAYAVLNQHGENRLTVDTLTLAAKGEIKITLNSRWSLTVLKSEAFLKGVVA